MVKYLYSQKIDPLLGYCKLSGYCKHIYQVANVR